MGIQDRRERERQEKRELILKAAREIINSEGIDSVTVRKIADKIEYTAPIIYHYFKDKDEIIDCIMREGYKKIIESISIMEDSDGEPASRIEDGLRNYIKMALKMKEEYRNLLLNSSPNVLEHTSVLFEGASKERKAIGILCECIEGLWNESDIDKGKIELTAQVIWTSTFGLIIRLMIEDFITIDQKEKLINCHIEAVLKILKY
ncbi:TetR/AcrR family transcriptional regulator [Clostridium folliculivorans]|uniref:TetR family transcriptional regulator n=1 Tax=Clostridium folliculivorans TaxID=2886038 RepID=A0A9W5Y157_9CLOT|nr:TetR/AcrR family transcriptional regulator [Clostridium folliculivorans]GKU24834.1 TetR family transcriptional regulator [Clostridium folliculivorans]GKU30932.1 TetR family transcriptional regulator [Clostridium folliculivorans]